MTDFHKRNGVVALGVFLISSVVYLKTVAPTVSFWDCGEFIATSYILGVPHPPGAPLYTLLGRLFTMLPIPGEIAVRVNLMSALSSVASVVLIYLCAVHMLSIWLDRRSTANQIAILSGGAVAALSVAFSTSFWSNAIEAEVYALSMGITLLAFWLALRWDEAHKDHRSDRLLLFIPYLFGLGAGVHLQCLLTVPGILILVFTDLLERRPVKQQVYWVIGLTLYPVLALLAPLPVTGLIAAGILVALLILRPAWRNPWFWGWAAFLAMLGFSTYLALAVRSTLNPIIDMNDPQTWENFKAFLSRQQYGTHSVTPRRSDIWGFQLNIHLKYFLQQFPFYDHLTDTFRRAIEVYGPKASEVVEYSILPLLLGVGGAVYHLRRDWRRFAAVFAMFALMGLGLVVYLNMPDPEPREREYIFVGAYIFFGFWMGIGAAGLIVQVGRATRSLAAVVLVAVITLSVPAGILHNNYFHHDRTGDYVSHDYAYNILQTCAPDALLFTNGDNDTYPLWFLQYVKGVRTDVRIVNLSLIKTPWYIRQLRDLPPTVPINLSDDLLDRNFSAWPWQESGDIEIAGLTIKDKDIPKAEYFVGDTDRRVPVVETHTWVIWRIVQQTDWKRPIYFAVTVPQSNQAGLSPHLSMEGMAYRLVQSRGTGQFSAEHAARNLFEVYRYEGVADSALYKDPVAARLLGNYIVLFDGLVQAYTQQGRLAEAVRTIGRARELVPPRALDHPGSWHVLANHYQALALKYAEAGSPDSALICMEELIRTNPGTPHRETVEDFIKTWSARIESLK